jgi:hypothetical protein
MSATGTQTAKEQPHPPKKPDPNLVLMKAMGATWYNPTPEWQHAAFEDKDLSISPAAHHQLSFWRKVTIGARKVGKRTPYGYDASRPEGKRDVGIPEIAELTHTSVPNATRVWNELVAVGLTLKDEQGRCCLAGKRPETKEGEKEGEDSAKLLNVNDDREWKKFCTDNFPTYLAEQLQRVSKAVRDVCLADLNGFDAFEKKAIAEATDAVRSKVKQARDEHLSERYRIKIRRFERKEKRAAAKATEKPLVQLSLTWPPELSVQNSGDLSVQNDEEIPHKRISDVVQNRSNKESEFQRENSQRSSPPTPSHAAAQEGKREPPTPSINAEDNSPKFDALLFAANEAHMTYAEGQVPKLRATYQALNPNERTAAIDGIRIRRETGEYDDAHFVPALRRYLTEQLWTAKLRPGARKKRVDTSFLDSE